MAKIFRKKRKNKPIDLFHSRIGGLKIKNILAEFNDKKKRIKSRLNNHPEHPLNPQERDRIIDELDEIDVLVTNVITIFRGELDEMPNFNGLTKDILEPMLRGEVDVPSPYKVIKEYPELAEFYFVMKGKGLFKKDFPSFSKVLRDFPELAKHFIKIKGINLREVDKEGNTPLHYALRSEHEENIKLLLQTEARNDLNSKNKKGETPAQVASSKAQQFLEKGYGESLQQYVETLNEASIHEDTNPSTSIIDLNKIEAFNVALNHYYGLKPIPEEPKSSHIKPRRNNKRAPESSIKSRRRRYYKRAKNLSIKVG